MKKAIKDERYEGFVAVGLAEFVVARLKRPASTEFRIS